MQALSLLQYDILKDVPHCFTTRLGGVSKGGQSSLNLSFSREPSRKNVLENYRRVSEALGVAFEGMTHVPQHHGDHVLVVTEKETGSGITKPYPDGAEAYGYDAMITDVPGTVLCTLHADCHYGLVDAVDLDRIFCVLFEGQPRICRIAGELVNLSRACAMAQG